MEAVLMHQQAAAAAAAPAMRTAAAGRRPGKVQFGASTTGGARLRCIRAHVAVHQNEAPEKEVDETAPLRLLVGLPVDSVSERHTVNHGRAVSAGLRALKLLGADGVELPVSWAVVQPESAGRFEWAGYRAVADMVRAAGLGLRVSLNVHGAGLPGWVSSAAAADPDILFTDRTGNRREDCLSFAVDELPVLGGRSPLDAYEGFFRSFAAAFEDFLGSTITDVTVSLGPNGELRYPSFPPGSDADSFAGVGEFQCYDKYMLAQLKRDAESSGHPLWGLSGPHDAPLYDNSPESCGFFRERGGSWETPYGDFFLSWYAGQLLGHGDRVLTVASKVFRGKPVELSAKVPFLHWWSGARSHPAEATAGYYGTDMKNGYGPVAEMFARHACTVIVRGMDVCLSKQLGGAGSNPEQLLERIRSACQEHGARLAGENAALVTAHSSSSSLVRDNLLTHFTYQRMGAEFFSPEHWPLFMAFVRGVTCPEADEDDLPGDEDGGLAVPADRAAPGNVREVQAV